MFYSKLSAIERARLSSSDDVGTVISMSPREVKKAGGEDFCQNSKVGKLIMDGFMDVLID